MKLPKDATVPRILLKNDMRIDCFDDADRLEFDDEAGTFGFGALVERTVEYIAASTTAVLLEEGFHLSRDEPRTGCRFDFRGKKVVRVSGIIKFFSVSISDMHDFQ